LYKQCYDEILGWPELKIKEKLGCVIIIFSSSNYGTKLLKEVNKVQL